MIRKAYVDTRDGQLHYRYTEAATGDPLVLFHMTAASSKAYEPLMNELEGAFPTIAFDTMNYGESYRTETAPTVDYIADIMLEALSNLDIERFHTFGHHTGVSIQFEMWDKAPQRVLSAIANGPTYAFPEELSWNLENLAKPNPNTAKGTQFIWAWSRTKENFADLPYGPTPDWAIDIMHRDTVDTLRAGPNWHWGYQAVFTHDLMSLMKRATCPIFLVSGPTDLSFMLHQRAAADLPDARTFVGKEGGVYYAESHAVELAPEIKDFISGVR